MALFGGKEKKENAQNELWQKLISQEYLDRLMHGIMIMAGKEPVGTNDTGEDLFDNSNEWITKCQSYYDSLQRLVVVAADSFEIIWSPANVVNIDEVGLQAARELAEGSISFAYTKDGYRPLHSYNNGEVTIETDEVLRYWALAIRERMQTLFPELDFRNVVSGEGRASFVYNIPELEWKDWF